MNEIPNSQIQCDQDSYVTQERAEKALARRKKVEELALEKTLAMGLPRSITPFDGVSHLGPIAAEHYGAVRKALTGYSEVQLPELLAFANAYYWYAGWDGACWFEVAIADGEVADNEYTRALCTAESYMQHEGRGPWAMCNLPFDAGNSLANAWGIAQSPDIEVLLNAVACVLFQRAESMAANGESLSNVMDLVCEAEDARCLENGNSMWESALESAREDPQFLAPLRSDQARKAALARLSTDKKQQEKRLVRECWEAWRVKPENYPSQAAFARDMLQKCPNLLSQKTVEDWCRAWSKAASAA